MNPQENTEKLIRELILPGNKAADERIVNDAMAAYEKQELAVIERNIWRTIIKNRITKLAAAAVIIIAVGFLAVHQGPDEQIETADILETSKSPAEMLTLASINAAYRKGEMEAVENHYERILEMMEPWPSKISIQELIEELNGS